MGHHRHEVILHPVRPFGFAPGGALVLQEPLALRGRPLALELASAFLLR